MGLQGEFLRSYAKEWIIKIEDISEFVSEQRQKLLDGEDELIVPVEKIFPVENCAIAEKLELSPSPMLPE